MKKYSLGLKRLFDLLISAMAILILLPVFLILSIWIKISSKGPVLFKQNRLGLNGKTFLIIKFRSMVVNAENLGDGLRVTSESDARITAVGKILRATSLDELPQLFNVFLGQMSLVGPRPPVSYYPYEGFDNYPEWAKKRFQMRPGITGLSQVTVRNSVPWDDRIVIDNTYIDSFSIILDIQILIKTVVKFFRPQNLYGVGSK